MSIYKIEVTHNDDLFHYNMEGDSITIGRGEDVDLKIDSFELARKQLRFRANGEVGLTVEVIDSETPCFISGRHLEIHQEIPYRYGDTIQIGNSGSLVVALKLSEEKKTGLSYSRAHSTPALERVKLELTLEDLIAKVRGEEDKYRALLNSRRELEESLENRKKEIEQEAQAERKRTAKKAEQSILTQQAELEKLNVKREELLSELKGFEEDVLTFTQMSRDIKKLENNRHLEREKFEAETNLFKATLEEQDRELKKIEEVILSRKQDLHRIKTECTLEEESYSQIQNKLGALRDVEIKIDEAIKAKTRELASFEGKLQALNDEISKREIKKIELDTIEKMHEETLAALEEKKRLTLNDITAHKEERRAISEQIVSMKQTEITYKEDLIKLAKDVGYFKSESAREIEFKESLQLECKQLQDQRITLTHEINTLREKREKLSLENQALEIKNTETINSKERAEQRHLDLLEENSRLEKEIAHLIQRKNYDLEKMESLLKEVAELESKRDQQVHRFQIEEKQLHGILTELHNRKSELSSLEFQSNELQKNKINYENQIFSLRNESELLLKELHLQKMSKEEEMQENSRIRRERDQLLATILEYQKECKILEQDISLKESNRHEIDERINQQEKRLEAVQEACAQEIEKKKIEVDRIFRARKKRQELEDQISRLEREREERYNSMATYLVKVDMAKEGLLLETTKVEEEKRYLLDEIEKLKIVRMNLRKEIHQLPE